MHPLSSRGDSFCCSSSFSHSDWSETISHTVGGHVQPLKTPKETEFVRETVIMSIRTKMIRDMKYPSTMESHQQGPWTKPTAMKQMEEQAGRGDCFNQVDGYIIPMYSGAAGNVGYHIPSLDESAVQRGLLQRILEMLAMHWHHPKLESVTVLVVEKFLLISLLNVGQVG